MRRPRRGITIALPVAFGLLRRLSKETCTIGDSDVRIGEAEIAYWARRLWRRHPPILCAASPMLDRSRPADPCARPMAHSVRSARNVARQAATAPMTDRGSWRKASGTGGVPASRVTRWVQVGRDAWHGCPSSRGESVARCRVADDGTDAARCRRDRRRVPPPAAGSMIIREKRFAALSPSASWPTCNQFFR